MEIEIFNKNFELLGNISSYTSFSYEQRFSDCGSFELSCVGTSSLKGLLKLGNVLSVKGENCQYVIQNVEIQSQVGESLIKARGLELKTLLKNRVIWTPYEAVNKSPEAIIFELVSLCYKVSDIPERLVENLQIIQTRFTTPETSNVYFYGENLKDIVEELCKLNKLGYSLIYDELSKTLNFRVLQGIVRTEEAPVEERVVFMVDEGNILNSVFTEDDEALINTTLVKGETSEGETYIYSNQTSALTGLDRKEGYKDVKSLNSKDNLGFPLPAETIELLLKQESDLILSENQKIEVFDGEISENFQSYVYDKNYSLGDTITVFDNENDIKVEVQILSKIVGYSGSRNSTSFEFGWGLPTIAEKINLLRKETM